MKSLADRRFAMVAIGAADAFWIPPLTSPAGAARFARLGLTDFGQVYFAVRSAPLGRVPVEVVTAAFFGFHPSKVRRYIPSVWDRCTPSEALETLESVADETLREALGDWVGSPESEEVAALLREAAEARLESTPGRPLFAGYASLPWPDPAKPHLTIWHACVLLREFRGDSHLAVLVANGIDACECHLLMAAAAEAGCSCHAPLYAYGLRTGIDTPPDPAILTDREWPVADKRAAAARLRERGVLDGDGRITPAGMDLHLELEELTDRVSALPAHRGEEDVNHLVSLLERPLALVRGVAGIGDIGDIAPPGRKD